MKNLLHKFHEECQSMVKATNIDVKLERPPKGIEADLALPCFALATGRKKNPNDIAKELAEKMKPHGLIKEIRAEGPYVNFYADWNKIGNEILVDILSGNYGKGSPKKEKIMVEYSSPNSNKPLHIGHLRNDSIGMAMSNILEFSGYGVVRANLINDRGVHICQAMLAYKKWGKGKLAKAKPDHFVGDFYVLYHQKLKEHPELKDDVQKMLVKWESGDKATRVLWMKINNWAISGFKETYKLFGSRFDVFFLESQFYDKAKKILEEGLEKGVFYKNDKGALVAALKSHGLPDKIVLREDRTSIYITNDLALTKHKFEKYNISRAIWVVASEQNLYFKQLFAIFKKLGYKFADDCFHLSYGLVNLPEGKMKSREGKVVDADELIEQVKELALHEVNKRYKLPKKESGERAMKIALAAIKYYLISLEPVKDIMFMPEKAVSFEGDTGPYLQYTYARARSILRKSGRKIAFKEIELEDKEISIAKHLSQYPWIVKKCAHELKPHYLANYLFELATVFNEFYHASKVIGTEREKELLTLVAAAAEVLKSGLSLLGIDVLEEM